MDLFLSQIQCSGICDLFSINAVLAIYAKENGRSMMIAGFNQYTERVSQPSAHHLFPGLLW